MRAQLWKKLTDLGETFWVVPAGIVAASILIAQGMILLDRGGLLAGSVFANAWLYSGGATGARTLLGAVASSTVGVAGTIFSITIAALTLASNQMGPRLLRNFTRDRGNQTVLGIFLGTFSYALLVLRTVRSPDEGDFVPNAALTGALALAILCVALLVYFVHHVASRINVDTVIDLVHEEVRDGVARLTLPCAPDASLADAPAEIQSSPPIDGAAVTDPRSGYLQQLDHDRLADWAAEHGAAIRLLVRPGDYVFPHAPIALVSPAVDGAEDAIRAATALGPRRAASADLEFAVRQLQEVAVRALSPGINDPHTAMSVLERMGSVLCELTVRRFPTGVILRRDRVVLVRRVVDYAGLTDTMFHMIRQNAVANPAVLICLLDVLVKVASCERRPERLAALRRHAGLAWTDGNRGIPNPQDRSDLKARYDELVRAAGGAA